MEKNYIVKEKKSICIDKLKSLSGKFFIKILNMFNLYIAVRLIF